MMDHLMVAAPLCHVNKVAPKELARLFANLDADEQRQFFNALHDRVESDYHRGVVGFMQHMELTRSDPDLTIGGRLIQKIIGGDY